MSNGTFCDFKADDAVPAQCKAQSAEVGRHDSACKSIKIRFFKRRHILRLAPAEDFGGTAGMFRLRLYRRWIDKTDDSPLFFSLERLVKLVAALAFDDNTALPATYPDLRNGEGWSHAEVLTHYAGLRDKIFGTISVCRDTHLSKLDIAHAEHFCGNEGMYRARLQRRWLSDPDGAPRFLSRDELAGLISSLILNDAPVLSAISEAASTPGAVRERRYAVSARRRDANKKGAVCVFHTGAKKIRAAKPKSSTSKRRSVRSHTKEKYSKKSWSLSICPYAAGTMRIEGDRMPDPAWGF
jgi:hypothetical protein